ncbi:MAG: VWA domain-containing protein, partial [Chloroflexi bacterium]|nr:VWA domain-containing protein [Chloroflexota bacterium]
CKTKLELYYPGIKSQNKSKFQQLFILELDRLSSILRDKQLSIDQADIIITELVQRTRENRDIKRGVSVRGTIALREVLDGFRLLDNQISLKNIEKSALVTLPNRITPRRGGYESAKGIITDIIKEILYGIRFSGNLLMNSCISDNLPSNPCDKMPSIARIEPKQLEEGKKKEEQRKDDIIIVKAGSKADNNKKQSISGSHFSEHNNENLQVSTTDDYMKDLTQMLEQQRCLSEGRSKGSKTSQGKASTSPRISSKDLANTTLEMMDAKDRQWQKELDFNDIYMYYHLKQNQDGLAQPKQNYDYLKVIINNLLEKGILQFSTTEDNYLITYQALDLLLEQLISKEIKGKTLERLIGHSNENIITSRESTRRYRAGDNFRDISIRHTLRQIVRNGKQLSNIDKGDFKIYTKKKHRVQSDIALCIDSSSSMGYQQNLLLARIVAAGLIKAAIIKDNEVGITTFDDVSKTIMPLTSRKNDLFDHIMKIKAGGNTNIGDGIKGSAEMLLKAHNQNQKFIVLITDGQSTAISDKAFGSLKPVYGKGLSEEDAIIETRRAASRGIKTSVIYITDSRNEKYAFIRNIATAGRGIVNVVRSIEDIRLMMR